MDKQEFRALGHGPVPATRQLEVFPSRSAPGSLTVTMECTEFTCRCPVTNQPDWAHISIVYVPNKHVLESKSLKLYLETFREQGIFHEHLAQLILDDLVAALDPCECAVTVHFNVRGGIAISAEARWARRQRARTVRGRAAV